MTLCWSVWNARNKWIFEGEVFEVYNVLEYIKKLMTELNVNENVVLLNSSTDVTSWTPPNIGYVKVNVDVACFEGLGTGMGAVIRREDGLVIVCVAWMFNEKWEVQIAEAKAILYCVNLAAEYGLKLVTLGSDCQSLVDAIHTSGVGNSIIHLLLDDIYHAKFGFDFILVSYISRRYNKVAHDFTHCSPWFIGRRLWVDDILSPVSVLVHANSNIPYLPGAIFSKKIKINRISK